VEVGETRKKKPAQTRATRPAGTGYDFPKPHLSTFAPIGAQLEINNDVLHYKNKTVQLIMDWQNTGALPTTKSNEGVPIRLFRSDPSMDPRDRQ
jgi:hypothetical protein